PAPLSDEAVFACLSARKAVVNEGSAAATYVAISPAAWVTIQENEGSHRAMSTPIRNQSAALLPRPPRSGDNSSRNNPASPARRERSLGIRRPRSSSSRLASASLARPMAARLRSLLMSASPRWLCAPRAVYLEHVVHAGSCQARSAWPPCYAALSNH